MCEFIPDMTIGGGTLYRPHLNRRYTALFFQSTIHIQIDIFILLYSIPFVNYLYCFIEQKLV